MGVPRGLPPRPPQGGFSEGSGRYPRRKSRFRVSDAAAGAACLYSKFTVLSGGTVAELASGQDPRPRPRFSLLTSLPAGKRRGWFPPGLLDQAGSELAPGRGRPPIPRYRTRPGRVAPIAPALAVISLFLSELPRVEALDQAGPRSAVIARAQARCPGSWPMTCTCAAVLPPGRGRAHASVLNSVLAPRSAPELAPGRGRPSTRRYRTRPGRVAPDPCASIRVSAHDYARTCTN